MSGPESVVRLTGLKRLDEHELSDEIPADAVTFKREEPEGRGGTAHEPATLIAVVLLTSAALKGIAAWLLKKRHRGLVELEAEIQRPDGSFERRKIRIELSDSSSSSDVVRAVGEQLSVDPTLIANAST
jgi:hypothetical protein